MRTADDHREDAPERERVCEHRQDNLLVSTDRRRLDVGVIHSFLTASYWAEGIPSAVVERAVRQSLCFGLYDAGAQVGFARVVTDRATFAYLADVFVLESHRGRGLAKWLMECVVAHPDLQQGAEKRELSGSSRRAAHRRCRSVSSCASLSWRGVRRSRAADAFSAPCCQGLRRFSLATRDAHALYRRFGFEALAHPERHMEIARPGPYAREGRQR
jgi:GNAT superfamily N-acetyltransferase